MICTGLKDMDLMNIRPAAGRVAVKGQVDLRDIPDRFVDRHIQPQESLIRVSARIRDYPGTSVIRRDRGIFRVCRLELEVDIRGVAAEGELVHMHPDRIHPSRSLRHAAECVHR